MSKIDYQKLQKGIDEQIKMICPYCQSDIYPVYLPATGGKFVVVCPVCDKEINEKGGENK